MWGCVQQFDAEHGLIHQLLSDWTLELWVRRNVNQQLQQTRQQHVDSTLHPADTEVRAAASASRYWICKILINTWFKLDSSEGFRPWPGGSAGFLQHLQDLQTAIFSRWISDLYVSQHHPLHPPQVSAYCHTHPASHTQNKRTLKQHEQQLFITHTELKTFLNQIWSTFQVLPPPEQWKPTQFLWGSVSPFN